MFAFSVVCCGKSLRAMWLACNKAVCSAVFHATNRGPNARVGIACNTASPRDQIELRPDLFGELSKRIPCDFYVLLAEHCAQYTIVIFYTDAAAIPMGIKWAGFKSAGRVEGFVRRTVRAWVRWQATRDIVVGAILSRIELSRADCASCDTAPRSLAEFGNQPK